MVSLEDLKKLLDIFDKERRILIIIPYFSGGKNGDTL
jgi:hypothetical protein